MKKLVEMYNSEKYTDLFETRARLLDWLIEVTEAFSSEGTSDLTYFKTITILDTIIEQNQLTAGALHLYGVASLNLASKLLDYKPIDLEKCYKDVCHREYKREEIQKAINNILMTTKFSIDTPSWAEFLDKLIYDIFGDYTSEFGIFNVRQVSLFILHCMILEVKFYSFTCLRIVALSLSFTIDSYFSDAERTLQRRAVTDAVNTKSFSLQIIQNEQKRKEILEKICVKTTYPTPFLVEDLRELSKYMNELKKGFGDESSYTYRLSNLFRMDGN